MIEYLIALDQKLLLWINQFAGDPILDFVFVQASEKFIWLPMYGVLLYLIYKRFGFNSGKWVVLGALCLLILTDQGSVQLFKETFQRLRPCHNPDLDELLKVPLGRCGGSFGFISSHASNVFGLSVFLIFIMTRGSDNKAWWLLLLWATVVSISRVFLGVHYPLDICGGVIFGSLLGVGVAVVLNRSIELKQ